MRTLEQPGRALEPRRFYAMAAAGEELRVLLPKGSDLLEGLVSALDARGIRDAAVTFTAATFERIAYLTGQPDHSGERAATYGAPTVLEGPVLLLGANGILGRDANGKALLHCHAVMVDTQGTVHGGHLPPGQCLLGPGGAVARVTVLTGGGFQVGFDPETNYSIFQPAAGGSKRKVPAA